MRKNALSFIIVLGILTVLISGCSQQDAEETTGEVEAVATPSEASKTLANPTTEDIESRIAALEDEDSNVRANGAFELGIIADASTVEPLITALEDEDTFVRFYVIAALGNIGDERAVEPLIAAEQNESGDNLSAILSALGAIGGDRAVEALIEALRKDNEDYWKPAAQVLKGMGSSVVEPLIALLNDREDVPVYHAAYTLAEINNFRVAEALNSALDEGNLPAIAGACDFFIKVGKDDSVPLLISAIEEYGTDDMAIAYLNCGNELLADAAKNWAENNGYTITQFYISGESSGTTPWGGQ